MRGQRTKFNVDKDIAKRSYNGVTFASSLEMRYFRDVILPKVGSGEIAAYARQKPYVLQEKFVHHGKTIQPIKYVADFYLLYSDGREEVIDTKGMADASAKIKRKLFWFVYPDVVYRWIGYSQKDGGWIDYDLLQKLRRERKKQKERTNVC